MTRTISVERIGELEDGSVQTVQPDALTFLDSKELFDQYDWSEA